MSSLCKIVEGDLDSQAMPGGEGFQEEFIARGAGGKAKFAALMARGRSLVLSLSRKDKIPGGLK